MKTSLIIIIVIALAAVVVAIVQYLKRRQSELSLIVIFVITVVFLFEGLSPRLGTVEHLTLEQANAVPASMFVSKRAEDPNVAELQKAVEEAKGKPGEADAQAKATAAAKDSLY